MARHRAVRTMNLDDECYEEDEDYYGHSVEENYCISPATAAQFTFNRDHHTNLSSYMDEPEIPKVDPETDEEPDSLNASTEQLHSKLNQLDEAKLNSCLEEIRNILGETCPEPIMMETIIRNDYKLETALNELLTRQDAPKPQRAPRENRRTRSQGDDDDFILSTVIKDDQKLEIVPDSGYPHRMLKDSNTKLNTDKFSSGKYVNVSLKSLCKDLPHVTGDNLLQQSKTGADGKGSLADLAGSHLRCIPLQLQNENFLEENSVKNLHFGNSETSGRDWISNNVYLGSELPKLSQKVENLQICNVPVKPLGLSSHVVSDIKTNSDLGENQTSRITGECLGSIQLRSSLNMESSQCPVSISLSKLADQHHMKLEPKVNNSASLSLAELAKQHSPPKVPGGLSLYAFARHDEQRSSSALGEPALFSKTVGSLISLPTSAIEGNMSKNTTSKHSSKSTLSDTSVSGISLADLAKAHQPAPMKLGQPTPMKLGLSFLAKDVGIHKVVEKKNGESKSETKTISLASLAKSYQSAELKLSSSTTRQKLLGPNEMATDSNQTFQSHQKTSKKSDMGQQNLSFQDAGRSNTEVCLSSLLKEKASLIPQPYSLVKMAQHDTHSTDAVQQNSTWPSMEFDLAITSSPLKRKIDVSLRNVKPSVLGQAFCLTLCKKAKKEQNCSQCGYPKFSFKFQTKGLLWKKPAPLHTIQPFSFSTPSPDDIIKKKQKGAFTRTGKRC